MKPKRSTNGGKENKTLKGQKCNLRIVTGVLAA